MALHHLLTCHFFPENPDPYPFVIPSAPHPAIAIPQTALISPHLTTSSLTAQRVFKMWLEDHQLNEAVYLQITKAIAIMEEQPGLVAMYMAEREPYRLSC